MRNSLAIAVITLTVLLLPIRATAETRAGAPDGWPEPVVDSKMRYFVLGDQLEFRHNEGDDLVRWDAQASLGGDYHKLWIKTEGEARASGPSGGDAEFQFLYGWTFSSFWDFQVGVRQDALFGSGPNRERTLAVLGLEGLAPYWFEVTPALFVSGEGDVSARVTVTYDVLFTQRLIAQPRFELNVAAQDDTKFGVESGFNDIELGLRIRYELRREFAPYVGVNWVRKLGDTADLARVDGEDDDVLSGVFGIRLWF